MIKRLLVAVDDSPGALAAARCGIELAQVLGAALCAVMVVADGHVRSSLRDTDTETGREPAANAVLFHVSNLAQRAGVPVEVLQLEGAVATRVLEQARAWPADVVVLGRSRETGIGHPFIGSQARIVLEFAEAPVLVVPPSR